MVSNVLDIRNRLQARKCPVGSVADHFELGAVDVLAISGLMREAFCVVERIARPLCDDRTALYYEEAERATEWMHVSTLTCRNYEHREGKISYLLWERHRIQEECGEVAEGAAGHQLSIIDNERWIYGSGIELAEAVWHQTAGKYAMTPGAAARSNGFAANL